VKDTNILCPHCGTTLANDEDVEHQPAPPPAAGRPSPVREARPETEVAREDLLVSGPTPGSDEDAQHPKQRRHRIWISLLLVLLAIAIFVGALAASAYAGIYVGERDRETRREAVIDEHYQSGLAALNDGRFERAVAEFSYVLELAPDHTLAEEGLNEAQTRLEVKPTPTLEAAQSLAERLLEEAQAAYDQKDWVNTARTLTQLRALDPDYKQDAVEQMLFTSLFNAGQTYLDEDQLEVGISYLDQAIALRPLDAEVVARRNLAARYLNALNYWGVDWELSIERFEALYATAPDYKDVTYRLYQAHIEYGNYLAGVGEMCPAEIQYSQALRMYADARLEEKRTAAAQTCLMATPVPVSGTTPILTPKAIAGFTMGRLAYPVYNGATGVYDLNALYTDGRLIRVATNADHPSWEWSTGRLVYRNKATGAVSLILPEEGVPLQLLPPAQQAWPTLSPDSARIAYAAPDGDGIWSIYITNTDGSGTPWKLASGWAPAWGRNGILAYTGCDDQGICGITLDNPDDDQPSRRLTGSENDSAVSWSPAGNLMAYMGNVTGNWDIFLLSPEGGVQQLTSDPSHEGLPTWSPDGSSLAFVSNRDGNWAIYVRQINSGQTQRILDLGTNLPGWENQRLSWAP
jgi:Tol biopolymer transport system component/outer membrane protein assembly factor BamD (BamD/ComL family)